VEVAADGAFSAVDPGSPSGNEGFAMPFAVHIVAPLSKDGCAATVDH
jgi:hypothetical protein